MRKEAQPVRPNDSQQSFDEPISSKAVSKEAGGEKSDEIEQDESARNSVVKNDEANAVGESADGDEKEEDYENILGKGS